MKAKTLQIIWHSKDPVFSIDFHPDGYIATGGGDKDIKVPHLLPVHHCNALCMLHGQRQQSQPSVYPRVLCHAVMGALL